MVGCGVSVLQGGVPLAVQDAQAFLAGQLQAALFGYACVCMVIEVEFHVLR